MRHRPLRLALAPFALALVMAADAAGAGEEITIRFDGGPDRAVLVSDPAATGDLDGRTPLQDGVAARVAPGDLLTVSLDNPPGTRFHGRNFEMAAEAVKIEEEGGFLGLFTKEVRHPTIKSDQRTRDLEVGTSLQVILILRTIPSPSAAAVEFDRVYLPASRLTTYRVPRPADVFVVLDYQPADVEWLDRDPNDDEEAQLARWREEIKGQGFDEVNPRPSMVRAGNLDALRVRLVAERP